MTNENVIIKKLVEEVADIPTLTRGLAAGEEKAFREFHALYFHRLLRYILVVAQGNEDWAHEALQTTLIRVARHAKPFKAEAVFWSWLTVLARSAVIDEQRKKNRYFSFLTRWFAHREIFPDISEEHSLSSLSDSLQKALCKLNEEDRSLLEMKYYDGESVHDIAQTLLTSEKAIESRLSRLRQKLKTLILERLSHEK